MIKSLKSVSAVLSFITISFLISCNDDDDASVDCEGTICTAILVRLNITVVDENQNPVALDSFEVVNADNGQDITIELTPSELEGAREFGIYPLIEDGILGLNQERDLEFTGFIDGEEVVRSNYTVATDCCHVSLASGEAQLTL